MMTLSQLTELLGWASIINLAYLALAAIILVLIRNFALNLHNKLFDVDKETINTMYFDFLSKYKVVTMAFFVAPYLALKVMGY